MTQYQSKKIVNDPIFIRSKSDLENIDILGWGDKYINVDPPDKFNVLSKSPGLIPYLNSHDLPIYLFVGAVVFKGRFHYEVMSESEFHQLYEKVI